MIVGFAQRARRRARRHARRAARRRAAHAALPGHGQRERSEQLVERLGLSASRYEGPTGIVGVLHDACRQAGISVGEPLGRRPALRLAHAEPEGGARALRAARRPARRRDRHERAGGGRRDLRRSRSPRRSRPTRTRPRTSRSSSSAPTSSPRRTISRRATRSPPSSRASCASASASDGDDPPSPADQ